MDNSIDMRSDTVTRPTARMREAMMYAEVGDDILRDDPTVLRLEKMSAEMLGMEEAMFTASGTMSNEITAMVLARPGEEAVVFTDSHIYNLETGGLGAIAGVQVRPVVSQTGTYDPDDLRAAIMPEGVQRPRTAFICLENTFHLNRGLAVKRSDHEETIRIAKEVGIPLFLDGARLFNAAVALGVEASELADFCDAAAFCLCKGLAAPVGSILAGGKGFIAEARRVKQRLGGGWRQAGVIAAPAIIGLEEMVKRLPEDHANAEMVRAGLEKLGIAVDRGGVLTNIVQADLTPVGLSAPDLAAALLKQNIKVKVCTPATIRMVTHNDVGKKEIAVVLEAIRGIVEKNKS
jgi:threonine aldolase